MSRAKNPKYESMSLEKLKANMEKSRQELEVQFTASSGRYSVLEWPFSEANGRPFFS